MPSIPKVGEKISFGKYEFEVIKVEEYHHAGKFFVDMNIASPLFNISMTLTSCLPFQ